MYLNGLQWFLILQKVKICTGQTRLIQSDSSARFSFELSGNLNKNVVCNSKLYVTLN